jgi:hypothetical protein
MLSLEVTPVLTNPGCNLVLRQNMNCLVPLTLKNAERLTKSPSHGIVKQLRGESEEFVSNQINENNKQ